MFIDSHVRSARTVRRSRRAGTLVALGAFGVATTMGAVSACAPSASAPSASAPTSAEPRRVAGTPTQVVDLGDYGELAEVWIELDGKRTRCVVFDGYRSGGVSCDFGNEIVKRPAGG